MKTTKSKKPPLKGATKNLTPKTKSNSNAKKATRKTTPNNKKIPNPKITTKTTKKSKVADKVSIDFVGVGDDIFWSSFLSGKRTVSELRSFFELELERQKLDAIAEFAAGAGHEINNPLAIINGYGQILIRETDDIEHRRKLAVILAQVKRAYEMIADIRYFARPPIPVVNRFDIVDELRKIVKEQKSKLQETDQEINFEIDFKTGVESLFIETDQVQLHIAISAICNNARESLLSKNISKVVKPETQVNQNNSDYISICLREIGNDAIEISVEDNGVGISPDIRQLIFCPYFSGRQAGRGLGFGLPKTWRIIQQLNGSIKTETIPKNKNTKFTITIPKKHVEI